MKNSFIDIIMEIIIPTSLLFLLIMAIVSILSNYVKISEYEIVKVRGCEYVYGQPLVHAGDCSNPIHRSSNEDD